MIPTAFLKSMLLRNSMAQSHTHWKEHLLLYPTSIVVSSYNEIFNIILNRKSRQLIDNEEHYSLTYSVAQSSTTVNIQQENNMAYHLIVHNC